MAFPTALDMLMVFLSAFFDEAIVYTTDLGK